MTAETGYRHPGNVHRYATSRTRATVLPAIWTLTEHAERLEMDRYLQAQISRTIRPLRMPLLEAALLVGVAGVTLRHVEAVEAGGISMIATFFAASAHHRLRLLHRRYHHSDGVARSLERDANQSEETNGDRMSDVTRTGGQIG